MPGKIFFIVGNYLNCIFGFMHNKSCGKNIHIADRFPVSSFLFFLFFFFPSNDINGILPDYKNEGFLGSYL